MTARLLHHLLCNGRPNGHRCLSEVGGDPTVDSFAELRRQAEQAGWSHRNGRDLCADCTKREAR